MNRTRPSAFTLAEMLVVIAIILILAALLVPAAFMALGVAKNGAIAVELGQLDNAMKQYKVLYKNYPPSSNPTATAAETAIVKHIQASFGRAPLSASSTPPTTPPPYGMTAAEALVFWLQGYSNNPMDPLGGTRVALMQFDQTRLKHTRDAPGSPGIKLYTYSPEGGQGQPYVYIHNASYASLTYPATIPADGKNVAKPYFTDIATSKFVNPESYQIISAGQDGNYGDYSDVAGTAHDPAKKKQFPTGTNYSPGDTDNITNFSGGTLGSKVQ